MENKIAELEEHIHVMKQNSVESVTFLKKHIFLCLDENRALHDDINSVKEDGKVQKHMDEEMAKELQTLKEENLRKERLVQELACQLKEIQEERAKKQQMLQEQEKLIEDLKRELILAGTKKENIQEEATRSVHDEQDKLPVDVDNDVVCDQPVQMVAQETQTLPVRKHLLSRAARRVRKRCREFKRYFF